MNKIKTLITKEWAEVFKNRFVIFAVAFLPLLFTAIPVTILYLLSTSEDVSEFSLGDFVPEFAQLCAGLSELGCNQFIIMLQFMPLFLMLPVILPITIAAHSIVGEKTARTLEPLLATPITTVELLAGKGLAAALPAIFASWLSYILYIIAVNLLKLEAAIVAWLFNPLWLIAIFVVGPLLSLAAVSLAVMISSRTSDPRVAEQISGLLVLPLVGLIIAQSVGVIFINATLILWVAGVLAVLDVGLLAFAAQLFQRETILTRWK